VSWDITVNWICPAAIALDYVLRRLLDSMEFTDIYSSVEDSQPLEALDPPEVSYRVLKTILVFMIVTIAASRLGALVKPIGLPLITGYLFAGAGPQPGLSRVCDCGHIPLC
jgi:hypothetical protein